MKTLVTILLLSICTLSIDRPYNHWKIYFVKYDEGTDRWYRNSVYIDEYYLQDAVRQFNKQHPNVEIRCMARDYYELCGER